MQAALAIRTLIFYTLDHPEIIAQYGDELVAILDATLHNPYYLKVKDFQCLALYLQGHILTLQKKPELAYQHFSQALALSTDIDADLGMVVALGNAGYQTQALKLLNVTEAAYRHQPADTLKRSSSYYETTIQQTRRDMQKDLQSELNKSKS